LDEIKGLLQKNSEQTEYAANLEAIEQKRLQLWAQEMTDRFFFYSFVFDKTFSENIYFKKLTDCAPNLAVKCIRGVALCTMLDEYCKIKGIPYKYTISHTALPKILNDYTDDLDIIKKRRGIHNKIQFPKIAGLMANLIVKYRPVVPRNLCDDPISDINENFAIFHAICICTDYEGGKDDFIAFQTKNQEEYKAFYEEVGYLLKRNFTPESLISVFKTLCLCKFPKALESPISE